MLKLVGLAKRKPGMSLEDFGRYWAEKHAAIAKDLPGLRRYVVSPFIGDINGDEPAWDGMAELWFDDRAALEQARKSSVWAASGVDRPEFQDTGREPMIFLCVEEHEIQV